jgi:DNA-binding IclR family transcriptional regulator
MLGTILKAGEVFRLFDFRHPEWGVSEISAYLRIPKSNAHALCSSLAEIGLLRRTVNGRYRLGWYLFPVGQIVYETAEFRSEARMVMEELVDRYRETVQLGVLDRNIVIYLERIEGKHPVRVDLTGLGEANFAHSTAIGKILLAARPWEIVRQELDTFGLQQLTTQTITDLPRLRQELESIARQGYALNFREAHEDLGGVAAPIYDYNADVIAAISMVVPISRFQRYQAEYREAVVRSCRTISKRMGFIAPAM